ncbi:hypothetical protein [Acinetobacter baumannii]|uniref:hypothetical protein n=1 Tax=Acinetobacter baumannii TaxID=470 RepID=UPI000F3CFBBF|nr:hypothetical protein [Acinetobacter baumannii]MDQ8869064.1 hypothetical protein [Acinetobacter baumannii]RNI02824.1 hypothetical protein EEW84_10455 [Acinetobacter baumannii]
MKPEQFIRDQGLPEVKRILEEAPKHSQFVIPCLDGEMYFSQREDDGKWFKWSTGYSKWLEYFGKCNPLDLAYSLSDLKRLVESFDLIEKLGGYGKCKFYMTGMKLNKCDSVKCPKTGLIVSRAALEIAINDYRESIYGGGDD